MNKIEIKNRWTGSILFEYEKENNTLKDTVEKAIETEANLGGANLEGANLREANLGGANLEGANLRGAYLGQANLRGAYIYLSDDDIDKDDIIPTRWHCFWGYGLTICDWEIKEKEETTEYNKEIEEYKTDYTERCIDVAVRNKLNELVRAVNKLSKEREEK